MNSTTIDTIEALATECADEAVDAGTASYWLTEDLPGGGPMKGDFDALRDELGRKPTVDEMEVYQDAYAERIAYHRDGWQRVRRMKAVRDKLGKSQDDFAAWCGVSSQQRVSEWERGVRYPAEEKVKIAEMKIEHPELWT